MEDRLQQLKEEAFGEIQKFFMTNEPFPDFIDSLVTKAYEAGKEEEKDKIEKDIRDGWKHGDLREGNFENFMNQVFRHEPMKKVNCLTNKQYE